jgi:hypothetical protein
MDEYVLCGLIGHERALTDVFRFWVKEALAPKKEAINALADAV